MKKVIVVSKTHLDLGFTDYAENIKRKYIHTFIPEAIDLAEKVNTVDKKYFVWTTGSWILKEALKNPQQKDKLTKAIKDGNIAPHAMPFTTHTELLDEDSLDYGLSLVDGLDEIRGKKTISAKMTDVPGHTKGLVNLLARRGIKLLHIGVNGASALVDVPPCFLWKNGDDEIVVIYSGDYGGAFKCDLVDEVLYFDHTLDNHGAPSPQKVLDKINKIQSEYPDYDVTAGTIDDFAEAIWKVREKLPVFEGEMGDTWIHGSATDPYKSASLRTLIRLKNEWLEDGSLDRNTDEYKNLVDAILCTAEHTCGMDSKTYFSDYGHYLKKDFNKARKADKVKFRHLFCDMPQSILPLVSLFDGRRKRGYYSVIEKSWAEQRAYINLGLDALSDEHKKKAKTEIAKLIPTTPTPISANNVDSIELGKWMLKINKNGGISSLKFGNEEIIKDNDEPIFTYRSFCNADYKYWLNHYSRNLEETAIWALGDFARPCMNRVEGEYPAGRFPYSVEKMCANDSQIIVNLICNKKLCNELGAPRLIQVIYTLTEDGLNVDVSWYQKDANRLTEAIYMHLFPTQDVQLKKLGCVVNPSEVADNGSRNLHAVQSVKLGKFEIINHHSPLVSVGKGKILEFDNKLEDVKTDGLSFVLYNNVWGTNFPLWYEDNARFEFEIKKK
ncbi:MAG: DUF5054 domain-containing protein [Clostridia bacterium]|nr:DUF5054 domain-containing protein [Clostridia bacterium]